MTEFGKFLMIAGALIVLIGALLWTGLFPKWLGHLPGDVRIERGNSVVYFPIVTCILVSVVLSLLFAFFRR